MLTPCKNILPETRSVGYIFPTIVFFQFFVVGSGRRMFCAVECLMAVQGQRRSLILVPIENAYATSYFGGVPLELDCRCCHVGAPGCEDPELIIHAITLELTQPIRPLYITVTDGRTDGWTHDLRTIAIPQKVKIQTRFFFRIHCLLHARQLSFLCFPCCLALFLFIVFLIFALKTSYITATPTGRPANHAIVFHEQLQTVT